MAVLIVLIPVSGGAVIAVLSATSLPWLSRHWWITTIAIGIAAALANLVFVLGFESRLYRDAFALAIVAALCTFAIGWAGISLRDRSSLQRVAAAALTLTAFGLSAPFIGLLVHCTSGDCL